MESKTAYKMMRLDKDGKLHFPIVNTKPVINMGEWLEAEDCFHPKGLKYNPGFHCAPTPDSMPHIKRNLRSGVQRVVVEVEIQDWEERKRPPSQGSVWYLAKRMKLIRIVEENVQ